jgi:hypothetical protein
LVLGLKECLVECAIFSVKSEVIQRELCGFTNFQSGQQKINKSDTEDWFKVGIIKNSKFLIGDFVKPCGGEKLKILTFPSAKPTASIWG